MADVVPENEANFYQMAERPQFPWAQWLDGQVWRLKRDVDFPAHYSRQKIQNLIKYNARMRGVAVRIRTMGDATYLQAYEP